MKKICFKLPIFWFCVGFFYNCHSAADEKPVNNDSIVNTLNVTDTISKMQQKVTDSVNKTYLDSLKKHMTDSSSAEFPARK